MEKNLTRLAQSLPASVPFVGPETQERAMGRPFRARLGANESGFGPSPKVLEALSTQGGEAWMYGDPEVWDLRAALAKHHGVPMQSVVVGEGIDGLLGYLVRLFVAPGDSVVTSLGAYPTFNYHVVGYGGRIETVPYRDDHEDLEGLLRRAHDLKPKIVYLANPDNPMGTWHSGDEVAAFAHALPEDTLLALDEAYIELAPEEAVAPIGPERENVIRFRTFSKAQGLAGMRVGYALGAEPLITAFNKVRNHFGVGRISQVAALASLRDEAHLKDVQSRVARARDRLYETARANGLKPIPSATNFVTMDCGRDGDFARAVLAALIEDGVFVRMPGVLPLDRCIRVSVGPDAGLEKFEEALPRALAKAQG